MRSVSGRCSAVRVRRAFVWAATVSAALTLLSCGNAAFDVSAPACHEAADVELRGAWTVVAPPAYGAPGASDGEAYWALGKPGGATFQQVSSLDMGSLEWVASEVDDSLVRGLSTHAVVAGSANVATMVTDRGAVAQGLSNHSPLAVLSQARSSWELFEPEEIEPRVGALLLWTGQEFVVWGGNALLTEIPRGLVDDTELASYTDGYFYNPETGDARMIAPAWEPGHHTFAVNHPMGHLSSVWTPEGLFVWGLTVEQDSSRSALLSADTEEWRYYSTPEDAGPHPRRYAVLTYHAGYVYLHGGALREGTQLSDLGLNIDEEDIYLRDFWRFSLESETWEQLEVPSWADLQVASPAWFGDELMFVGMRCTASAIYDSVNGTWSAANHEDAPPSRGEAAVASGKVIVNEVFDVNAWVDVGGSALWVFDPAAD